MMTTKLKGIDLGTAAIRQAEDMDYILGDHHYDTEQGSSIRHSDEQQS